MRSIRLQPSTVNSSTSCRRSRRWARRSPSPISIEMAGRTSTSPTAPKAVAIISIAISGTERSAMSLAEMGVADVNQPGTGVSMGAVWGDYDNDGFEDLFLYKYGRPGALSQRKRQRLRRGQRARWVAEVGQREQCRLVRLRRRRQTRPDSRRATGRKPSTSGISRPRA